MHIQRPLFIVLEGIDGSGKSTQARLLEDRLLALGLQCHRTFEPTDNKIGRLIRSVIRQEEKLNPETLAALFVADRLDHILDANYGMKAQLAQGRHVVCDRYYFSSYAYHSLDVPMQWVIQSNSLCAELLKPDIIFFIDVDPALSMQRIANNREQNDLFETQAQLEKIRANYLKAIALKKEDEHIVFINGNQTESAIHTEIMTYLTAMK
ncbi:MAG: dTMP kinase [Chitinophagaceae bacterium]|nr:dTMP kinase [Chitinophagaceae bacterium]